MLRYNWDSLSDDASIDCTWHSGATIRTEVSSRELPSSPTTIDDATEVSLGTPRNVAFKSGVEAVSTLAMATELPHDSKIPQRLRPGADGRPTPSSVTDATMDHGMDDGNVETDGGNLRRDPKPQEPEYRKEICTVACLLDLGL